MDSQDQHIYYAELISRYLSGNANPAEIAELEAWVLADPENKAQFIAYKKAWMLAGVQQPQEKVNVAQMWQQTSQQISGGAKVVEMERKPVRSLRRWWGAAAAIVVLLIVSVWLFRSNGNQSQFFQTSGQTQNITLADGSKVILNRASSLRFTPEDDSGDRKVELTGDAFFDVVRDEAHPFVINAGEVEVEVLGTSFYVDSREQQPETQVVVKSGRVAVRAADREEILTENEQAIFQKENQTLVKQPNEDNYYLSLQTRELFFENTPIEEMVFAMNRFYSINISIENQALKNCPFSSTRTFDENSLDILLRLLEATYGLEVVQRGRDIVLKGGSCSQ